MLLKHNCTSQRGTVLDKRQHGSHPGTTKRPRAAQPHKVHVYTLLYSDEGALRGGLAAADRGDDSQLSAKLGRQQLCAQGC